LRYGLVNDVRKLDKIKLPRTVDRFVTLGLEKNTPLPDNIPNPSLIANKDNALATLHKLGIPSPSSKILGLCPGAEYGEAKRWPAEYYAEVAREALNKGWQVWLFGSEKDIPVTTGINTLTNNLCVDLGGKTNLSEAIDLMSLCDNVISNDSGLMHVAALDKKLVAIYGSSNPHHTPPMSDKAIVEYLAVDCSPCFKRECPLKTSDEYLKCLKRIEAKKIITSLNLSK
jgi:heptosyltransferase-2